VEGATSYEVSYLVEGQTEYGKAQVETNTFSIPVASLAKGKTEFAVIANNAAGRSRIDAADAWSDDVSVII